LGFLRTKVEEAADCGQNLIKQKTKMSFFKVF